MTNDTPEHALHRLLVQRDQAWRGGNAPEFQAMETRLRDIRAQYQNRLETLAAQLQAAMRQQSQLVEQVQSGRLSAEKANDWNRRLLQDMEAARAEIARFNRLVKIDRPEDLHGVVTEPAQPAPAPLVEPPASAAPTAHAGQTRPTVSVLNRWFTPRDIRQIQVAAVLLVLAVLGVCYVFAWRHTVTFQAAGPSGPQDVIRFVCANKTTHAITLDLSGQVPADSNSRPDYSIGVYVSNNADGAFRLVPDTFECWGPFDAALTQGARVTVLPGITMELCFLRSCLQARLPKTAAVRIVCCQKNGTPVYQFTTPEAGKP